MGEKLKYLVGVISIPLVMAGFTFALLTLNGNAWICEKSVRGNLLAGQASGSLQNGGGTTDTQTKIIIAIDTSASMQKNFFGESTGMNIVQSTAVFAQMFAAEPNTSIQIIPFCSNKAQTEGISGENSAENLAIAAKGFVRLGAPGKADDLRQVLSDYQMSDKAMFTALNAGLDSGYTAIDEDSDDENAEYTVILVTDGQTAEDKKALRAKIEKLINADIEIYLVYPTANGNASAVTVISQTIGAEHLKPAAGKDELLKQYTEVFSEMSGIQGGMTVETAGTVVPDSNLTEDSAIFSVIYSNCHYGLAVAAPDGYYVEKITRPDNYGNPVTLYPKAQDSSYGITWAPAVKNSFCYLDTSDGMDEAAAKTYEYSVAILPLRPETAPSEAPETEKPEIEPVSATVPAPVIFAVRSPQDNFSVSVNTADGIECEKSGTGDNALYSVGYGKDIAVCFCYMESSAGGCTLEDYDYTINGEVVETTSGTITIDADHGTAKILLPANKNKSEKEYIISVINRDTGAAKRTMRLNITDLAPAFNENVHDVNDAFEAGGQPVECRFYTDFSDDSTIEVSLNGLAIDPEGSEIMYFLDEPVVKINPYSFSIEKKSDGYYLEVALTSRAKGNEEGKVSIMINFRDENGNEGSQEIIALRK